jgi:hypothetical protein
MCVVVPYRDFITLEKTVPDNCSTQPSKANKQSKQANQQIGLG